MKKLFLLSICLLALAATAISDFVSATRILRHTQIRDPRFEIQNDESFTKVAILDEAKGKKELADLNLSIFMVKK